MKQSSWNVAVVGAAGMVGREMVRTLEARRFPVANLRALDAADQRGTPVSFRGESIPCQPAGEEHFREIDLAIFSAGADASLELAPAAVRQGAIVVDNSSAWRMHPDCPLVVPEVNPHDLSWHHGIIANPNCSTIQLVMVLKPIHDRARIRRVVVSTYQSASGAGKAGVDELTAQSRDLLERGTISPPRTFQYQLAFNLIPQIDVFQEMGYTKEEWKMVRETTKIMGDPSIRLTATTVRVPVTVSHAESVNIETERKLTVGEVRDLLQSSPGLRVLDDPATKTYPTPVVAAGSDDVFVGRIREDNSLANGINLWIVADNVRKGAALNAVQIAERLLADGLVKPR